MPSEVGAAGKSDLQLVAQARRLEALAEAVRV
jgi:hypothetical protein